MHDTVRRWAEAALLYITESLDNQQLMEDMAAAMAASLQETEGPPAPEQLSSAELTERYKESAVLHAVRVVYRAWTPQHRPQLQAVPGPGLLDGPLRAPLQQVCRFHLHQIA